MQKVNLLDEVEGIWRAPTRILSYLYTNIIYIKYNIKIAIFFFLSEVIPDTFLQSLTHCRQCLSPKLRANAVLFTHYVSPAHFFTNAILSLTHSFPSVRVVLQHFCSRTCSSTAFIVILFIRMLQLSL